MLPSISKSNIWRSPSVMFASSARDFLAPRRQPTQNSSLQHRPLSLVLFALVAAVLSSSAAQKTTQRREFSAYVLMRMAAEKSGIGGRVYVQGDKLYLDFPGPEGRHIPVWFLNDGVVASVKDAWSNEDSKGDVYPGPGDPLSSGDPLSVGFFLHFRSTNPNRFCQEFRSYYIKFLETGGGLSNEELKNLHKTESYRCEATGREIVAQRDCRTYRLASGFSEYWTKISYDPKLTTILLVQWNPPQGAILRLDAIKEGPQQPSLFVPPPGHVVVVDPKKQDYVRGR